MFQFFFCEFSSPPPFLPPALVLSLTPTREEFVPLNLLPFSLFPLPLPPPSLSRYLSPTPSFDPQILFSL